MRLRGAVILVVIGLAAVVAVACDGVTNPSELQGVEWRLVSLHRFGSNEVTVDRPERYTLRFEDDGRVRVRADCNVCGGRFELADGRLTISSLFCTRVACPPGSLFNDYVLLLERESDTDRDPRTLVLRSSEGVLRFVGF